MRILMLAQFYPPIIGGEERHVRVLSTTLAARGHRVVVVTLWHPGLAKFEISEGVTIYRVHGTLQRLNGLFSESERRHSPPFPDPELVMAISRIIAAEKPQIIHAHNWLVHSFLPLKLWSNTKLIMTLHDYSLVCVQKRLMRSGQTPCEGPELKKCLDCAAIHYGKGMGWTTNLTNRLTSKLQQKLVDIFLPVSNAVAIGTKLTESRLNYEVVPNFIPDTFEVQKEKLEQLPEGDYLLYVGDLSRDKGIEVLLEAYRQHHTDVPLVLIGRRSSQTPTKLPPNVLVFESWPHAAVMQAWKRCTFGIVPSIWQDPCPTVAMEAMAVGRPVIASSMGGLIDIVVDRETGLLVPPNNAVALAQAISFLLEDREFCTKLGQTAQERVVQFRAQAVVNRIEQIYQNQLGISEKSSTLTSNFGYKVLDANPALVPPMFVIPISTKRDIHAHN